MASTKIFLSCLVALTLFNFIFYISGFNTSIFTASRIIGVLIYLVPIAVLLSMIPTTSGAGIIKWVMMAVIVGGIFFSISIPINVLVYNYDLVFGIGLATNLIDMFSPSTASLEFLPFMFFTLIGLIGLVSGLFAISGGD